jgi:hypothetical protein
MRLNHDASKEQIEMQNGGAKSRQLPPQGLESGLIASNSDGTII